MLNRIFLTYKNASSVVIEDPNVLISGVTTINDAVNSTWRSWGFLKNYMFSGNICSLEIQNLTSCLYMFENCSKITSIEFKDFDTSNVKMFSEMFEFTTIDRLILPFDTSSATDMSSMFNCCSATYVDISSFDTSKVTDMSYMLSFYGNPTIYCPQGLDMSSVTNIEYMFNSGGYTEPIHLKNVPKSLIGSGFSSSTWKFNTLTNSNGTRGTHYIIDSVKS